MLSPEIRTLVDLTKVLLSDVYAALDASKRDPNASYRRLYVRAVLTMIEGRAHQMREYAIGEHKKHGLGFSNKDVKEMKHLKPWSSKFLKVADAFAKATGSKHRIDDKSKEWAEFNDVVDIRNRLTHPTEPKSFDLSKEDLAKVDRAFEWYRKTSSALLGIPEARLEEEESAR